MMIRRPLILLALLTLTAPAQALKLSVWDRELQTKLGDGESVGSRFNVRLVGDYDGPVVVLFAQTEDERAKNAFPGLKSSYNGTLLNGQLTLQAQAATTAGSTGAGSLGNPSPSNTNLSLGRFLAGFKLTLSTQPAGQSLTLPGLKNSDSK